MLEEMLAITSKKLKRFEKKPGLHMELKLNQGELN